MPPPFTATISANKTFRFSSGTNAGTFPITRGMLLNLVSMCSVAVGSSQARLLNAVRLKSVEMWGNPPLLGGVPVVTSVEWVGQNSPSTLISDTSMGVNAAHVLARPPPDSSNRWWSITGSNESEVLFEIEVPAGTIIDVKAAIRFIDDEAGVSAEAGAAATLGTVYYNYLDGFASKKLAPIDVRVLT